MLCCIVYLLNTKIDKYAKIHSLVKVNKVGRTYSCQSKLYQNDFEESFKYIKYQGIQVKFQGIQVEFQVLQVKFQGRYGVKFQGIQF